MQYWEVIWDAIKDTAKILPILFIVYYIIELVEYKYAIKFQNNKFLKGKASPAIGALLGCVPQCGFSVVSTDLYTRGSLSIGALIAVYIATSDEAIPLMISNPSSIKWLLILIGIKIVIAILVGYLSMWLYNLIFKKERQYIGANHKDEHMHEHTPKKVEQGNNHGENLEREKIVGYVENVGHDGSDSQGEGNEEMSKLSVHGGCCHHHVETKSFDWVHPLLHCLKISLFILIVNLLFGFITEIWIGSERLTEFLSASIAWQPLLAILIGLIPNCVSSVVITELFLMGGLSFGSLVAGLMVNAGLGLIVLLKQNKNWKENLFIFAVLIVSSLVIGYALNFII